MSTDSGTDGEARNCDDLLRDQRICRNCKTPNRCPRGGTDRLQGEGTDAISRLNYAQIDPETHFTRGVSRFKSPLGHLESPRFTGAFGVSVVEHELHGSTMGVFQSSRRYSDGLA